MSLSTVTNRPTWAAAVVAVMLASATPMLYWRRSVAKWTSATFDINLQLELKWGQIVLVLVLVSSAMFYIVVKYWVQKALKPRRTAGNVEITTATVDFLNKLNVQEVINEEDGFERMETIGRPQEVHEVMKSVMMTPESRVFAAFSQISCHIEYEEFHKLYQTFIEWVHLDSGEVLIHRGDALGDKGMFIVLEGSVSAYRENLETPFHRCGYGDLIGDLSMLCNSTRFATYKADTKVELVHISRAFFSALVESHSAWILAFIRTSIARNWYIAHFALRDFLQIPERSAECQQDRVGSYFVDGSQNAADLQAIASKLETIELAAGQLLYEHSTTFRRNIYILKKGRMCLIPRPPISDAKTGPILTGSEPAVGYGSKEIGAGSVFGGMSFVTSCAHQETARCLTTCEIAVVSTSYFTNHPDPTIVKLVMLICEDLICPVLRQFEELAFERCWVPAGKLLFKTGDRADECYILVSGRLRVFSRRPDGVTKTLLEASRGESVGELSLLSGDHHHSSSCISVRDCEIVRVSRQSFMDIQVQYPFCLQRFSSIIARRLRELGTKPASHTAPLSKISTIAVIPTGPDVPVNHFVERLANALKFYGSAIHVNREIIFEKASEDGHIEHPCGSDSEERLYQSRITHALNDLEETHEVLIFSLPDSLSTTWARCFVRQADKILIVGDAASSPIICDRETVLLWQTTDHNIANRDLVLLHNDDVKLPKGTRFWFEGRTLNAFHHVRKNSTADYGRLARCLSGRAVSVVLGGGGARGLSHMGTMQALHELQVPVDMIGGTSQGAFMAGLFAMHGQLAMEEQVKQFAAQMGSVMELLKDATFPIMSYFSGYKFSAAIYEYFGDTRIEDLWIPYFCVTTNLTESDIKIHTEGLLWTAIRSSMTVIEYLPPMYVDGAVLIDGGYVDNLPVDIMRDRFNPDILIAVDVENKASAFRGIHDFGVALSGWWLLWLKIARFLYPWGNHPKVPKFADIVLALSYINNSRNVRGFLNDKLMDVYIRPELGSVLLLDYHKYEEIRMLGYRQARLIMSRWVMENRRLVSDVRGRSLSDSLERQQFSESDLVSTTLTNKKAPASISRRASDPSVDGLQTLGSQIKCELSI